MLTGALLVSTCRQGKIYPLKLKLNSSNLELAKNVIHIFNSSIGERRQDLEEQIKGLTFERVNPKIIQGMQKILFDHSEFTNLSETDPTEIRINVFDASAAYWKQAASAGDINYHKRAILRQINQDSIERLENTESWLFGDIAGNQKLVSVQVLTPEELIERFNISQVQGLLLNAQNFEIKIERHHNATFRQAMQMMKFFRLMFDMQSQDQNWLTINVDGPGSILDNARSYGLELAQFFPAVLLLNGPWQIEAIVKRSKRARASRLKITDKDGYKTFYRQNRVWLHEKIKDLINALNDKFGETLKAEFEQRIISLKNNRCLLPDIVIKSTAPQGDGKNNQEMLIEWIPFISESKIKWLQKIGPELPKNYVFALKGKRIKLKKLIERLGSHLLLYASELTAGAVKKQFLKLN